MRSFLRNVIFDDVGVPTKKRERERKRKRNDRRQTVEFFFGDTLFVNALPLYYLLFLLLLYVTSLCTTLYAGYFRTWPVRYTNGRRTRAELSVATRSRSRVHVHENDVDDIHKRSYTHIHMYIYIIYVYMYIRTYIRICTHIRVDRCTCPCFARPSVTLNRSNFVRGIIKKIFF